MLFKYFFDFTKKGLKSHFAWLSATGPPALRRITWSLVQERSVRWWRPVRRQSEKKRWQALCLALTIAPDLPINPVNSATSRVRVRVASWRRVYSPIKRLSRLEGPFSGVWVVNEVAHGDGTWTHDLSAHTMQYHIAFYVENRGSIQAELHRANL